MTLARLWERPSLPGGVEARALYLYIDFIPRLSTGNEVDDG